MSFSFCFRYTCSLFLNTMMLMSVLVSLLFIAMAKCHPISYNTYDERELSRDHPPLLLLIDHRIPDLEVRETSLSLPLPPSSYYNDMSYRIKKWNRLPYHRPYFLIDRVQCRFSLVPFSPIFLVHTSPARINKTRIQILKVDEYK